MTFPTLQPSNPVSVNEAGFQTLYKPSDHPVNYSPINDLITEYTDNVESFRGYMGNNPVPFIGGRNEAYETRARNQGGWQLAGNAITRALVGEFVGGGIQGFGTLLAPNKWVDRVKGTTDAFEETFLEHIGSSIQDATNESFPIYLTNKAEQGMAMGDPTWWANILPSTASALSILLPARAAAILPAKLTRYLGKTARLMKGVTAAEDAAKVEKTLGSIGRIAKSDYWTNVVSSAVAGRVIDSTRESLSRYGEYYEKNIANGMTPDEARADAADTAARGFRLSHMNLAFDLLEWGTILKMGNYANKSYVDAIKRMIGKNSKYMLDAGTTATSKLGSVLTDMMKTGLFEGADEMTMDIFQNEGKYRHDVEKGLVKETTFTERLSKHLGDKKSWDSFIGGLIGGWLMMPIGVMQERIINRKGIEQVKKYAENISKGLELNAKTVEEMSKHIVNGDHVSAMNSRDDLLMDIASKSYINNSMDFDKEMFDHMLSLSDEQLSEQGIDPSAREYIEYIRNNMDGIKKIYDKEMDKIRLVDKDGNIDKANFSLNLTLAQLRSQMYLLDNKIEEFKKNNNYDDELDSNEAIQRKFGDQGLAYFNSVVQHKNTINSLNDSISVIQENINRLNETIAKSKDILSSDASGIDKLIANSKISISEQTKKTLLKDIDNINKKIEEEKSLQQVRLKAFDGLDNNGNPMLTSDMRTNIDEHIKKTVDDAKVNQAFKDLQELKVKREIANQLYNQFDSNEGREQMREHIANLDAVDEEDTKSKIEDKIKNVESEDQLDALEKKYSKVFDKSLYQKSIKNRRKELRAKAKVDAESIAKEELERKAKEKESDSSATNSPIVPGSEHESTTDELVTNLETVANAVIKSKHKDNTSFSKIVKNIVREDETDNLKLHIASIFDLVFNKENKATIFEQEPDLINTPNDELFTLISNRNNNSVANQVFNAIVELATNIEDQLLVMPSAGGMYEVVGVIENQDVIDKFFESIDNIDLSLFPTIANEINNYLFNAKLNQLSVTLTNFADEAMAQVETELFNSALQSIIDSVDYDFRSGANPYFDLATIGDVLNSSKTILQSIIRTRFRATGTPVYKITFKDVLKVLRDNDTIYDKYREVFFGLRTYKEFMKLRKKTLENKLTGLDPNIPKLRHAHDIVKKEIERLERIDNIIDLGKTDLDNLTDEVIDKFLQYNPKETTSQAPQSGVKAVLNTYDKENKPIELSKNDVTVLDEDDNIYQDLEDLVEGAEVMFEPDQSIKTKNSPEQYNIFDQPIRVKVSKNGVPSKNTALFIRSLQYYSNGIRYGRKEGQNYVFHGIGEVLTNDDYNLLAQHMPDIKAFYYNYRMSFSSNRSEETKLEHRKKFIAALNKLTSNNDLMEIADKIVNQNLDDTDKIEDFKLSSVLISVFDAVFYKVRLEDLEENSSYMPYASILKSKIENRDKQYKQDFEITKNLRIGIATGTITSSKITHITTPPVIHMNDLYSESGKLLPRYTLDTVVKPIHLFDEKGNQETTEKRIVLVKNYDGVFYDLSTGKPIKDKRFDSAKYNYSSSIGKGTDNIKVLLESNNGKLIPYDVLGNTLGASYIHNKDRAAAIEAVYKFVNRALGASTMGEIEADESFTKHIIVHDQARNKEHTTRKFNYFETYTGAEDSRVTFAIPIKGSILHINVVNRGGIINIYRSKFRKNIVEKFENGKVIKPPKTPFNKPDDFDIDTNTPEGLALYERKMKEIIPQMLRQSHIDHVNHKFTFDKNYKGGEIQDPITGETYKDATDYYIRTGSLYSRVGAILNKNQEVVTNFDLRGRSPMSVTIDYSAKPVEDYTVNSVEELIGKDKPIDQEDPYIDFIKDLEQAVKSNIKGITVHAGPAQNNKNTIGRVKRVSALKYTVSIFSPYFSQKTNADPLVPASTNIAHELLHIYMNKKYASKNNETEEERQKRYDNILYHNKAMTEYLDSLTEAWNKIPDQVAHLANALNISIAEAKNYTISFNNWLKVVNDNKTEINDIVAKSINEGKPLTHEHTIQEPITYAYTNPLIALTLNSINASKDVSFNSGSKKSFWNLLIDKLFNILKRLFATETNNLNFDDKSQLAKLNAIVNNIFNTRLRAAGIENVRKASEQIKKDVDVESKSKLKKLTQENETDHIEEVSEEDMEAWSSLEATEDLSEDDNVESSDESTDDIDQEAITFHTNNETDISSLIRQYIDPNSELFDDSNNPIC